MKSTPALHPLAQCLYEALPDGPLRQWAAQIRDYHSGAMFLEPIYPADAPYYGEAVAEVIQALKIGWVNKVAYHISEIKRAAGDDGLLYAKRPVHRVIGTVPQPTDRKSFDSGHRPRAGG